jgi:hypothetical protein
MWRLMSVIHRLDEFDSRAELGPPILIFSFQAVAKETVDVLNGRQQTRRISLNRLSNLLIRVVNKEILLF